MVKYITFFFVILLLRIPLAIYHNFRNWHQIRVKFKLTDVFVDSNGPWKVPFVCLTKPGAKTFLEGTITIYSNMNKKPSLTPPR